MSLLGRVAQILRTAEIPFALIGASAMAAHGVGRSTLDQDLLVVDPACLRPELWAPLEDAGARFEIQKGDVLDPLAGVVRFSLAGERPVDLVVGKFTWQRKVIERALETPDAPDEDIPVVRAADLILLKLYAGGPQDAWDIQQLLAAEDRESLIAEVDPLLPELPAENAALWRKILES
jgi:hypothetical protein